MGEDTSGFISGGGGELHIRFPGCWKWGVKKEWNEVWH